MSKKRIKIPKNATKKELISLLDQLCKQHQNEISFNDIKKIADAIGLIYQEKNKKGKGSQERFYHESLEKNRYYNGFAGIHIIHKGGDKVLVRKINYKKFLDPAFRWVLENS